MSVYTIEPRCPRVWIVSDLDNNTGLVPIALVRGQRIGVTSDRRLDELAVAVSAVRIGRTTKYQRRIQAKWLQRLIAGWRQIARVVWGLWSFCVIPISRRKLINQSDAYVTLSAKVSVLCPV